MTLVIFCGNCVSSNISSSRIFLHPWRRLKHSSIPPSVSQHLIRFAYSGHILRVNSCGLFVWLFSMLPWSANSSFQIACHLFWEWARLMWRSENNLLELALSTKWVEALDSSCCLVADIFLCWLSHWLLPNDSVFLFMAEYWQLYGYIVFPLPFNGLCPSSCPYGCSWAGFHVDLWF